MHFIYKEYIYFDILQYILYAFCFSKVSGYVIIAIS